MEGKITAEEHRLWLFLRQIYSLITEVEERVAGRNGITSQQYIVLWMIEGMSKVIRGPITITDLAPHLYRRVNSISTGIDRMEKRGLVRKVRDLPDRRSIRIRITRKGHERLIESLKPYRKMVKRLLSVFSDDELQAFILLLKKLEKKVLEEPGIDEVKVNPSLRDAQEILKFINKVI
jgi:DNA-binding MarR family transcriptional regulator